MPLIPSLKKIASTVGPFLLAILLLYFALRGIDSSELVNVLSSANYIWLIPLVIVTLISHWLRAWRWSIFLQAVPGHGGQRFPMSTMFGALIVGYMINNVTTRIGEVVKSGLVSRREKVAFSSVVGTVVLDRIVDVIMLGLAVLSVLFILRDQTELLSEAVYQPTIESIASLPGWLWIIVFLVLAVGVAMIVKVMRSNDSKLKRYVKEFSAGLTTIARSKRPLAIIVSTVLMWMCYVMMAYIPFLVLNLATPYSIGLTAAWVVMNVGAMGIVVPAPGGIGSYHYITILMLTAIYGLTGPDAAAYAFLTHGAQLVLYTIVGFIFVLYFGLGWKLTKIGQTSDDSV